PMRPPPPVPVACEPPPAPTEDALVDAGPLVGPVVEEAGPVDSPPAPPVPISSDDPSAEQAARSAATGIAATFQEKDIHRSLPGAPAKCHLPASLEESALTVSPGRRLLPSLGCATASHWNGGERLEGAVRWTTDSAHPRRPL